MPGLSVVLATFNEADLLGDCLDSVRGLADEIVIADASSTDATVAIARRHDCLVIASTNRLMVEANKNLAIDAATRDWILVLDPDERVSPLLRSEIRTILALDDKRFDGYWMPRRNYVFGRWLRTMGLYPGYQLRLVRRGRGRFAAVDLHQPIEVDGPVGVLSGHLVHRSREQIADLVHKRNLYSEHRARRMHERGERFSVVRLVLGPPRVFVRQYVLLGGWLEGVSGFLYARLSASGELMAQGKLWQLERGGGEPTQYGPIPPTASGVHEGPGAGPCD